MLILWHFQTSFRVCCSFSSYCNYWFLFCEGDFLFAYSTGWHGTWDITVYVSVLHTCVHITSNMNWPGITLQPQAQPYWCSRVSPSFVDHYKHKIVLASQLKTTKIYTCDKNTILSCTPPLPFPSFIVPSQLPVMYFKPGDILHRTSYTYAF